MPRMDGTGPNGQGPMTGRGFGACNTKSKFNQPNMYGRGLGNRYGFGCFWRRGNRFRLNNRRRFI